jgi:hypothetical protein
MSNDKEGARKQDIRAAPMTWPGLTQDVEH